MTSKLPDTSSRVSAEIANSTFAVSFPFARHAQSSQGQYRHRDQRRRSRLTLGTIRLHPCDVEHSCLTSQMSQNYVMVIPWDRRTGVIHARKSQPERFCTLLSTGRVPFGYSSLSFLYGLYSASPASSAHTVGSGGLRRRLMRPEELRSDLRVVSNWVSKINNPVTASRIARISPMIWSRSFTAYLPGKSCGLR